MAKSSNESEARQAIAALVEKYERVKKAGKLKKYTEEETKKDFILPLFNALGWDVYDRREVSAEESVTGGRVDYGFYLDNRVAFYLEAKAIRADLDDAKFANQAVSYSWNKGVAWAVLTDFEGLKVFNAQDIGASLFSKIFLDIPYTAYLDRFDDLRLLSKESLRNGRLDAEAEKRGKKLKKSPVTEKLYRDLNAARLLLTHRLAEWNQPLKHDPHLLDEGVQRILDRLVFIRVAEDRGIEPPTLEPLVRDWKAKWKSGKRDTYLYQSMASAFRVFDEYYNSNIFAPHPSDKWEDRSNSVETIIETLRGEPGYYEYDFAAIPADVLGAVYEQYLGHRLARAKKGDLFDGETVALAKDAKKRKEQGIYYTPTFIVDYIVERALGPALAECKSVNDLQKLKVLDPACGSGSFLIAAFKAIQAKYREFGSVGQEVNRQILLNNIFGVDLDEQAVELTRLNLLLAALEKRQKLPTLDNIRVGNSLLSGSDAELKKHFGAKWRDKKPFNWHDQFPEVFRARRASGIGKHGGFDVVIGNPPYGAKLSAKEQEFFKRAYEIGSTDTAVLFTKLGRALLKAGGRLGFIVPKAFAFASNWRKLREHLWDELEAMADGGKVWREVKLEQVVIVSRKDANLPAYDSAVARSQRIVPLGAISKKTSERFGFFLNGVSASEIKIAEKILAAGASLNDIATNRRGAMLQKEIGKTGDAEVIGGAQLSRDGIIGVKGKITRAKIKDEQAHIADNAVLVQRIVAHIENPTDHIKITAAIPEDKTQILVDTVNQLAIDKKFSPHYVWALLNSELVNWFVYRFVFAKAIRTMQFDNPTTEKIPIPAIPKTKQKTLVALAKEWLAAGKKLRATANGSEKYLALSRDITRLDQKINAEVYRLYGLTEKEIKIVEGV